MRVSEQISNGSTDHPKLQKSRSDQGLHLLEPSEATAVLKTRARLCIRIKGGSCAAVALVHIMPGMGITIPSALHTYVTLKHLKSKQAMEGR